MLGKEHKKTIMSLNNTGLVLQEMEDYEGALDYYLQALRMQEKVLGKTHPDTLDTIYNMAITYGDGLGDQAKEEAMYGLALDGYEKSLGKDHKYMRKCARNLATLLEKIGIRKEDLRKALDDYPHLEQAESWDV